MNEEFNVISRSQKAGIRQAAETGQQRPPERAVTFRVFSERAPPAKENSSRDSGAWVNAGTERDWKVAGKERLNQKSLYQSLKIPPCYWDDCEETKEIKIENLAEFDATVSDVVTSVFYWVFPPHTQPPAMAASAPISLFKRCKACDPVLQRRKWHLCTLKYCYAVSSIFKTTYGAIIYNKTYQFKEYSLTSSD